MFTENRVATKYQYHWQKLIFENLHDSLKGSDDTTFEYQLDNDVGIPSLDSFEIYLRVGEVICNGWRMGEGLPIPSSSAFLTNVLRYIG